MSFNGGKDTVIDVDALIQEPPTVVQVYKEEGFEHLDIVWADKALTSIFPQVVELLKKEQH